MELKLDKTTKILLGAIALGITFFISGCDGVNPNGKKITTTLELYNAPPSISSHVIDAENDKLIVWHATFHEEANLSLPSLGEVMGSMMVIKSGSEQERFTNVEFDWKDSNDSIVISSIHAYPANALETDKPIHRAIIGGTGKYIGAKGEIISNRQEDGWYHHKIILVE
jgi:hypothetical protein